VDPRGPRWRRTLAPALGVLAVVLIAIAGIAIYAAQNLFDADRFAERATSALAEEDVRAAASERIADGIIRAEPNLIGARPLLQGAANGIVASPPFQQLFRSATADLHRTVFEAERDSVALKVADVGVLVIEALQSLAPKLAAKVPDDLDARLIGFSKGGEGLLADAAQIADDVRWVGIVSLLLALLAVAGAIAASTERRRTVRRLATAAAVLGVLGIAAFEVGRALVATRLDDAGDAAAAQAIWDVFLVDLRTWAIVLAAFGLIVAAAAAALIRPVDAAGWPARAWAAVAATPSNTGRRTARALALVAAGAAIVLFPDAAVRLAVLAVGAAVLFVGVGELLRLSLPPEPVVARERRSPLSLRRAAIATAVAGVALAAAVGLAAAGNDPEAAPLDIRACNGSAELCDRTVDEVVFPSTHNSFSAADQPNWLFAQHERGISAQLEAGVRGLLIDTHYGVRTDRGVYTVLNEGSTSRDKLEEPLGQKFVETAERLRARIGYEGGGKKEVFLCHGFCETGATDGVKGFGWIRDYLVQNPYEVVVLSVESDIGLEGNAQVIRDSGLLDMVWKQPVGAGGFPTLREMIAANRRVLVLVWQRGQLEEAGFGDYPWMHRQFGLIQETPYEFKSVKELLARDSCRPNGGRDDNPLFLMNHWVDSSPLFLPRNAREVNAYDTLLERAQTCARIRDLLPNLIAVDFYQEGDLFEVSRKLNGLEP
jgi:hypothetical protein